jgi:hypothetical protein
MKHNVGITTTEEVQIMAMLPEEVITDLEKYISLYNISISKEARKTFTDIEEFSYKCNYPCNYLLYFSKVIRNTKEVQKLFHAKGINPNLAALILEMGYYNCLDGQNSYQRGTKLYSYIYDRERHDKTAILDKALQYCVKEERNLLENRDILMAAMDYFEAYAKYRELSWTEGNLNTEYMTLAHVYGKYEKELWIKFDEIKEYLTSNNYSKMRVRWV